MFERIVVAYDGSEPSRAAAQLAFSISEQRNAKVILIHAIEPIGGLPAHPEALSDYERQLRERETMCENQLEALEREAPINTPVESRILHSHAAAALLDALREESTDLLVAGTHGVGGLKPLLGSVSHQLVEHAQCPVLLIRDEPSIRGELSVIAAVDGSDASMEALTAAQRLATALDTSLRLVHVIDLSGSFIGEASERMREHGRDVLRQAVAAVDAPLNVVEELREGPIPAELIGACKDHLPAVAAVGTRGIGGFTGLLVGSTARALINDSPCPVLVTKHV